MIRLLLCMANPSGRAVWRFGLRPLASNPAGAHNVCLLWVLYVVRQRSICGADHSSRGVYRAVSEGDLEALIMGRHWSTGANFTEYLSPLGDVAPWGNITMLDFRDFRYAVADFRANLHSMPASYLWLLEQGNEKQKEGTKKIWLSRTEYLSVSGYEQVILDHSSCLHHLWKWNWQCVPKRRHLKFRRRGLKKKKA